MARKHANKGQREKLAERRLRALELRKAGLTYVEIGAQLDISESQAWNDVKKSLDRLAKVEQDSAREYRQLELERTEALIKALWLRAKGRRNHNPETDEVVDVDPDYKALDRVLKLMEYRRRLLGLDVQPEQNVEDHTVTIRVIHDGKKERGNGG
jgi:hypothetical protein